MENCGVPFGDCFKIMAEGHTITFNFQFSISYIIQAIAGIFKKNLVVHKLQVYSLQIVHPDMSICGIIGKKETISIYRRINIWLFLF